VSSFVPWRTTKGTPWERAKKARGARRCLMPPIIWKATSGFSTSRKRGTTAQSALSELLQPSASTASRTPRALKELTLSIGSDPLMWNDQPGRTKQEVIAKLRACARRP
jgi:hypothetical protein